jgi:hypothetical protein
MPVWSGKPVPINRMLGQVDQDDPTNLPVGCGAVVRNTDFTRDATGSALCWNTRAGNCAIMQGSKAASTGLFDFQYQPVTASDAFFQMPLRFTYAGAREREVPVGTGRMAAIPGGMFALPTQSHEICCQAGNVLFSGYSNLDTPTAQANSCFNPKTLNTDPMGMKPYGFRWTNATYVYAGEVVTPSQASAGPQGNGHTYQAQNSGWTAANANGEPVWPLNEGGTVIEAGVAAGQTPVTWKEITMVIANRLPAPPAAALSLVNGAGTFPANQTVWILLTLVNGLGETVAGNLAAITTTAANQGVRVGTTILGILPGWVSQLKAPYAITGVNIYEVDVPSGSPTPAQSSFELALNSTLGATPVLTGPATGAPVPTNNSARITPGQLPTPDTEAVLVRDPGAGTFPAGRDVWIRLSYSNANGETPLGPSNSILNTNVTDAIAVTLDAVEGLPQIETINVYEADVESGAPEPPASAYAFSGSASVPNTLLITQTATGKAPVTVNGTGPGGNVVADTETGGINNTQGYRYAVPCWINRNETFSGFTKAAVSKYIVDEDGWEIAVFNVPLGPANVIGRAINWSVADGTQSGPFWWIGLVNLDVPTQNQVYPNSFESDGISITPTVFLDNVTTSGTFNFTDDYLKSANNTTDRLRVVNAPAGVRVDYLETIDRVAVFGAKGYSNTPWISLGADYESFYSDTSPLPIRSCNGFNCWGALTFRNQIWYMGERSCGVITPGTGDPASWDVVERWNEIGPCGPRAFAACAQFIIFVHRSGVYRYDGTANPDMMSKEIPRMWSAINWNAQQTIHVTIDTDTHTVRIQAPIYGSQIPNMEFCLSYLEGWQNPLHFNTFSQLETSFEAARRWSFNDVSAFICRRIYRTVPNPPPQPLAPDGTLQTTSDFYISQLAYASAIADGLVNARTPGRYDDNGAGIDWKCQTVSASLMQRPSKPEGVVISAVGNGPINVSFLAGRKRIDDPQVAGSILKCTPIDLTPRSRVDYTRKPGRATGEYWNVVLDNGKVPGVWASVKKMTVYVIPVKQARGTLDAGSGR